MNRALATLQRVEVTSRAEWRAWLAANHTQRESIWLVTYKKAAGDRYLPYDEMVEEALCFGWIDGQAQTMDELRTMRLLAPRKPKSIWSGINKGRVERLANTGLMTDAGMAKVEAAKRDGSWDALTDIENGVIPDDLAAAFARFPGAAQNFDAFPLSARRFVLGRIGLVKRPETRAKRVEEAARNAANNIR